MSISIPSEVFDKYFEAVDYMIDSSFGVNCTIYYPPIKIECENCYFNTMPGVGATNIYRPGGPNPFDDGVCPYCNGLGFKTQTTSESIKIRVYFDTKTWTKFNPKIAIKDGDAVLIGHIYDLPKLQHMSYIELATDVSGYNKWKYELSKEPIPWGFKRSNYFTTNVSRVNGQN